MSLAANFYIEELIPFAFAMSEPTDESTSYDHLPYGHPLRSAARHRENLRLREEYLARYRDQPAVQEWLRQFREDGKGMLERFAESYADYTQSGKLYLEWEQRAAAELQQEARERLWEIQQRKLWLLHCRWRAEEIQLPADFVEIAMDFELWGQRIHRCPHLTPITAAEVEGYLDFLLDDACTDADPHWHNRPHDWQDYHRFRQYVTLRNEGHDIRQIQREATENPGQGLGGLIGMLDAFFLAYPQWYSWCDEQDGPPNLLLYLPDTRGEKEDYYRYFFHHGHAPEDAPEASDAVAAPPATPTPPPATPPPLKYLHPHDSALTETLIRRFESPELLRYFLAYQTKPETTAEAENNTDNEDDDWDDDAHRAGEELLSVPERLPIEANDDWRKAVYFVWLDRRKRLLADAIRAAFAAYQERQRRDEPHPRVYKRDRKTLKEVIGEVREQILGGREKAGEPRNFDF